MRKWSWAGIAGVCLAVLGLLSTLIGEYGFAPPRQPPRPMISIEINGVPLWPHKEPPPPPLPPEPLWSAHHLHMTGVVLGTTALVAAVVSFLRREKARWGLTACCVGVAAMAWTLVVIVLAATVFFMFLSGMLFMGLFVPKSKGAAAGGVAGETDGKTSAL